MDKNNIKYLIIIVISVGITIMFTRFCTNIDGEFDNSIFWNAVSAITGICGFMGVIYTLHNNEKIRNKQNEYEMRKGYLIKEQDEFRRACYEELKNINPKMLFNQIQIYISNKDKMLLMSSGYEYLMNVNGFFHNLKFFYKYKNEEISNFGEYYCNYTDKSWNILKKVFDINEKNDKVIDFHGEILNFYKNEYEELREKVMQLIDNRQNYIEEELKSLTVGTKE